MGRNMKLLSGILIGGWSLLVALEAAGGCRTPNSRWRTVHRIVRALRAVLFFVLIIGNALLVLGSAPKKVPLHERF